MIKTSQSIILNNAEISHLERELGQARIAVLSSGGGVQSRLQVRVFEIQRWDYGLHQLPENMAALGQKSVFENVALSNLY